MKTKKSYRQDNVLLFSTKMGILSDGLLIPIIVFFCSADFCHIGLEQASLAQLVGRQLADPEI